MNKKYPKSSPKNSQAGFSMVELAIVLVVIGLIIGGVLKGQELIVSARLKSVLSQLNEYRVATGVFLDRYDALPGDYAQAVETIDEALKNGKNNGIIDGKGLNQGDEAIEYWAHLAAAHLIASPVKQGHAVPTTRMGGWVTVTHNPKPDMPGHWFVLGNENGDSGDGALLTPEQAMSLDKRTDNGDPNSGRVRSFTGANAEGTCVEQGHYHTKNKARACVTYFQF